jgi:predicted dinucleotide-binding enzyme
VHTENDETLKTNCAIKAITGSMHIVKAFNTEGYEQLLKPFFKTGKTQLILVGESKKAKEITKILASELGINYWYDFGTNENLPLFVEMTRCWRNMMGRKETENRKISFKH